MSAPACSGFIATPRRWKNASSFSSADIRMSTSFLFCLSNARVGSKKARSECSMSTIVAWCAMRASSMRTSVQHARADMPCFAYGIPANRLSSFSNSFRFRSSGSS